MEKQWIIGTGKIGAAFKNHAWFWLQILACDPEQNPTNPANRYKLHYIEVCATSDIISVHCH
jgi:lactate dehydrogenase-like 2-hydroxyacid dehydrogenase